MKKYLYVNINRIINMFGTLKLFRALRSSKNGVVHESRMRANTHEDILMNIDIEETRFIVIYQKLPF